MSGDGSEEDGFYAFIRWLIGESREVSEQLNDHFSACLNLSGRCFCLLRHRHAHVRSADVGEDGHLPGDALQKVWETLQRGSLLQREFHLKHLLSCDEGFLMFFITSLSHSAHASKSKKLCLCFQHCLPLPGFLLLSTDIYNHGVLFSQSSELKPGFHLKQNTLP